jgi:hypothetical protein
MLLLCALTCASALAHVEGHPSIHDTIAGVLERLRAAHDADALARLGAADVLAVLTEEDRHVLATEFWSFNIDVPARLFVLLDAAQAEVPVWLADAGFEKTAHRVVVDEDHYDAYQRDFEVGHVGLGYPGFAAPSRPYFVALAPKAPGAKVKISKMYPGRHRDAEMKVGEKVYTDRDETLGEVPEALAGSTLLRGVRDRARETRLLGVFRKTAYPATATPDHVVLTWSDDPRSTQTIQWRTAPGLGTGYVQYHPLETPDDAKVLPAERTEISDPHLANDPVNHRYTVTLRGLAPGTTYAYRVGAGSDGPWGETLTFATAPDGPVPFKFVYMGDAQNGLDTWGKLLAKAHADEPDARFYVMAGDLVNRGVERDDWDSFFHNARGVFDQRQLVPCIGNHEDQGDNGPWMYLDLLALPKNGPESITPERAYSFTYSNALFVVLDSNLAPHTQSAWLEQQLANSTATWKFVVYHHPAYASSPRRDNPLLRNQWTPLFDKYHVDLALQGHDHAYLRTYPMHNQERVGSPAEGTIYIVSVSGTKFYDQAEHPYTEFGMTNVATYQVLDITIDGDRLVYKAYDIDGELRDEFVIEK